MTIHCTFDLQCGCLCWNSCPLWNDISFRKKQNVTAWETKNPVPQRTGVCRVREKDKEKGREGEKKGFWHRLSVKEREKGEYYTMIQEDSYRMALVWLSLSRHNAFVSDPPSLSLRTAEWRVSFHRIPWKKFCCSSRILDSDSGSLVEILRMEEERVFSIDRSPSRVSEMLWNTTVTPVF